MKLQDVIPSPPPSASGWASLHEDMLGLILDKVFSNSVYDYVRCATVCKSWFYSCAQYYLQHRRILKKKKQQLPLLLIPTANDGSRIYGSLYNIMNHTKSCNLTVPYCKRYCGSSHGWLIFDHDQCSTLALTLFNPFTGATIHLPPLLQLTGINNKIKKVVLSDDPSSNPDNYEVLALQFCGRLALFTSRRGRWIYEDDYYHYYFGVGDIIYLKGKFHAFIGERLGSIEIYNVDDEPAFRLEPLKGVDEIENITPGWGQPYLAESICGTLLYIQRYSFGFSHVPFRVYELEEEEADQGIKRFIPLLHEGREERGLGDQTLFLDNNHSTSVRASNFPGCKPNSIYFIDFTAVYTYTVGDEQVEPLYIQDHSLTQLPSPIWIEPQLNLTYSLR